MNPRGNSLIGVLLLIGISGPIVVSGLTVFSTVHTVSKQESGVSVQKQIEIQGLCQHMSFDALNAEKIFALPGKLDAATPRASYLGNLTKASDFTVNYNVRLATATPREVWHSAMLLKHDGKCLSIFRVGAFLAANGIEYTLERVCQGQVTHRVSFKVFGYWDFTRQDQAMPKMVYNETAQTVTVLLPSVFGYGSLSGFGVNEQNENYVPRGIVFRCGLF